MTTRNATLDGRLHDCPECGCSHVDFRKPPADVCADCKGRGRVSPDTDPALFDKESQVGRLTLIDCPSCRGTGDRPTVTDAEVRAVYDVLYDHLFEHTPNDAVMRAALGAAAAVREDE